MTCALIGQAAECPEVPLSSSHLIFHQSESAIDWQLLTNACSSSIHHNGALQVHATRLNLNFAISQCRIATMRKRGKDSRKVTFLHTKLQVCGRKPVETKFCELALLL